MTLARSPLASSGETLEWKGGASITLMPAAASDSRVETECDLGKKVVDVDVASCRRPGRGCRLGAL
eukprot:CAMPEP_0183421890 /NCGR_PEP_ID=MMETSP0370-20130417/27422_1 /TAXON_ID=268820 /ORGANISM="Peridinium aciculiferum, Strain PAER-2" /LENGTH=65 /DNA_ID=CAMNT_0025605927 /DNA_START=142 /DNA_END=339 /DNA_ORIENTATION=+